MSKDTSTKVGAVLVGDDKEILLTAFNGPPIGVDDSDPTIFERPRKYLFVSHAEQNIIAFAARNGITTKGKTLFVTHAPCDNCTKSIIQAGIKRIYIGDGSTSMPVETFEAGRTMLEQAKVEIHYV